MKYCIECAEQLDDGAKFCFKCGSKQTEKETSVAEGPGLQKDESKSEKPNCKSCGGDLENGWVSCPHCGKRVEKEGEAFFRQLFDTFAMIDDASQDPARKREFNLLAKKSQQTYEKLPQNDCGECGCTTCYSFTFQVHSSETKELTDCPYVGHKVEKTAPPSIREYSFFRIFMSIMNDVGADVNEEFEPIATLLEMTPQSDCGECGYSSCFEFVYKSMLSFVDDMDLSSCPYVDEDEIKYYIASQEDQSGNSEDILF